MKTQRDQLTFQALNFAAPGDTGPVFLLEDDARFVISISNAGDLAGSIVLDRVNRGETAKEVWSTSAPGNYEIAAVLNGSQNRHGHYRLRAGADFSGAAEIYVTEIPGDVNLVLLTAEEQDVDLSKDTTWVFVGPHGANQPLYMPFVSKFEFQELSIVGMGYASAGAYDENMKVFGRGPAPPALGVPVKFAIMPVNLSVAGTTLYATLTCGMSSRFRVRYNMGRGHWQLLQTSGDVVFNA